MADVFPTPEPLTESAAVALGGTTDQETGLAYVGKGVSADSTPTLEVQMRRVEYLTRQALAMACAGWCIKTDTLKIGVWPFNYRKADGTAVHYEGVTDFVLTASNTNYVYVLHSTNALTKSTSGWPADITTFTAIAEVICGASDITSITDRRGYNLYQTNASSSAPTGTTATSFTIDDDETGAGVDQQVRFNRGSTDAEDAAIEWDESNDRFSAYKQHTSKTACPVNAEKFQVGGTDVVTSDGAAKVQSAVAGDGLSHSSGVLAVDVDDATIEINSNQLRLKDGGITTGKLGDTIADKLVQMSVGNASGASPQTVTIQAKDLQGNNLAEAVYVRVAIFDDSDGATEAVNATIAVGGSGSLVRSITAGKDIIFKTDANGTLAVVVTDGVAETVYILVCATFRSRMLDCNDIGTVTIS